MTDNPRTYGVLPLQNVALLFPDQPHFYEHYFVREYDQNYQLNYCREHPNAVSPCTFEMNMRIYRYPGHPDYMYAICCIKDSRSTHFSIFEYLNPVTNVWTFGTVPAHPVLMSCRHQIVPAFEAN